MAGLRLDKAKPICQISESLEVWLSGRKRFIANEVNGSNCSAGSNPVTSAYSFPVPAGP